MKERSENKMCPYFLIFQLLQCKNSKEDMEYIGLALEDMRETFDYSQQEPAYIEGEIHYPPNIDEILEHQQKISVKQYEFSCKGKICGMYNKCYNIIA